MKLHDKSRPPAGIGLSISAPILDADRYSESSWNVPTAVLSRSKDGTYKVGYKEGVLMKMY
jgi:hypothetical protein